MAENNKAFNKLIDKCFDKHLSISLLRQNNNETIMDVISANVDNEYVFDYPYSATLKVTSECNLRCKHCFYHENLEKFKSQNDFSTDEMMDLIKYLVEEINILSLVLSGGEPFLNEDIFKFIEYAKSKNVYVSIKTNATMIDDKIAEKLKNTLNLNNDSVQVSLDGATEETNDKVRGKGSFQNAIKGINFLQKQGVKLLVNFTPTSINYKDIPDLYELCKRLNIKNLLMGKLQVSSQEQAYLIPPIEEVFELVAKLMDKIDSENSDLKIRTVPFGICDFVNFEYARNILDKEIIEKELAIPSSCRCHKHENIFISADGKLYLCPLTETEELCLGDLKKNSFTEIWERRFSNPLFGCRKTEDIVCNDCKYISLCKAGCPGLAYFKYGSINAPGSNCKYVIELMSPNNKKMEFVNDK